MRQENATSPENMKILIVDDIPENTSALALALESEGFTLAMASCGEEALEIVESFLPDLILMDVRMDGIDGFETCRQLKKNDATSYTPVIFLTVSQDSEDIKQGFQCGGVDYICKPFSQEEVCARVRTHLHLRELIKEKEKLVNELQSALATVKTLSGLLPICSSCKKIRDDTGYWNQIESYIRARSEAEFTHSICPNCSKTLYPGLRKNK
jgi:CheY-like chemotaxis protein